jgi:NAD(P)H-hydrate epimerase
MARSDRLLANAMIVTCAEMKSAEERAFAAGVAAEALMEEAGRRIAEAVCQFVPSAGRCVVFFGKGHNGGDALVGVRHLARMGWAIELRPVFPREDWAELTLRKHSELLAISPSDCGTGRPNVVLDGLLGIGAGGALREPVRSAAREINRLRTEENALVFAIDIPTGLDGDSGEADPDAVIADFTLTIGCAKAGLLADTATDFVGRLAVLPLADLNRHFSQAASATVATSATLAPLLPRRRFDLHKGGCGRVGIVAGSPGMTGAAVMAAEACVHAGAGLVTLHVSREAQPLIVSRVAPEVMVRAVDSYLDVLEASHDVLAIGPGLGTVWRDEILALIERVQQPTIIDADGLNALASRVEMLAHCAGPRLLTPHPGEMARLAPAGVRWKRREVVENFAARFPITLLLKGARTLVGERNHPLSYNTTGTPGMASGGMGDVLTGVLAALAAQGLTLFDAARTGAWLCGRAAEITITRAGESEESLSATHVIARLGEAFRDMRGGCF